MHPSDERAPASYLIASNRAMRSAVDGCIENRRIRASPSVAARYTLINIAKSRSAGTLQPAVNHIDEQ